MSLKFDHLPHCNVQITEVLHISSIYPGENIVYTVYSTHIMIQHGIVQTDMHTGCRLALAIGQPESNLKGQIMSKFHFYR